MCGIAGIFSPQQNKVSRRQLIAGIGALEHRGPDLQSHWISENKAVGLAHSRLSIIDLSTGQQPLSLADGSVRAVVNGEFYNYEIIREELIKGGADLKTKSDSEILLHLYREMGVRCFERLEGEFAFILWDDKNKLLIAGRDRFGVKPLYYSRESGILKIASEPKALFGMGLNPEWDLSSALSLHSTFIPSPFETLYRNINQLQPGQYFVASEDHFSVHTYWDLNFAKENQELQIDESSAIEETRRYVVDSVNKRLRADVEVGFYLSGGIDSAGILGIAAQTLSKPVQAFSISFEKEAYDELAIAERMAKTVGAKFHKVNITDANLADNFYTATMHSDTVCINGHGIAKFLLSGAVKANNIRCVLTGEGADEIFGGYPHFKLDYINHHALEIAPAILAAAKTKLNEQASLSKGNLLNDSASVNLSVERLIGFVPAFLDLYMASGIKMMPFLNQDFANVRGQKDFLWQMFTCLDSQQFSNRSPLHKSMYLWSKLIFPNYMLSVLGDRMEMANSIEGRLPYLDHHLVEFVNRLPAKMKMKNLNEKFILREALKPFVTSEIYSRGKHPFLAPPMLLSAKGKFSTMIQDTIRSSSFFDLPFYNHAAIIKTLDNLEKMDLATLMKVDPMLMFVASIVVLEKQLSSLRQVGATTHEDRIQEVISL